MNNKWYLSSEKDTKLVSRPQLRGLHLDLKGLVPTIDRIPMLFRVVAAAGYNMLLIEWEDAFPWTIDRRFRGPAAYSADDVKRLVEVAQHFDLEIVPLVQSLGHMETPLGVPGYEYLREVPDQSDVLNPLADGALSLVQGMIDDVLALVPGVKRFHLGGDEAWTVGTHPDTSAYIETHSNAALYLQHMTPLFENLSRRGVRPMLWHDMMIKWDDWALSQLGEQADVVIWDYSGHLGWADDHCVTEHIDRFRANSVPLWGAGAYKGADGRDSDLPDLDKRLCNATVWSELSQKFEFEGLFATAWSRYSKNESQCEPIDGSLDALAAVGLTFQNGRRPNSNQHLDLLASVGELDAFKVIQAPLLRLCKHRLSAWELVRILQQCNYVQRQGGGGNCSVVSRRLSDHLRMAVEAAEQAADEAMSVLKGRVKQVCLDAYFEERLGPLRDFMMLRCDPSPDVMQTVGSEADCGASGRSSQSPLSG